MCGLWLSGEWERCAVGRQGSILRQVEVTLNIWPGASGTCERLVAWPGPAVLEAGGAWCRAGASGTGVSSLCRQQSLGEVWECLPQIQSLEPLCRVSLAVHSAGAAVAEYQLITPCHQSIFLVSVGTTGQASWSPGTTYCNGCQQGGHWERLGEVRNSLSSGLVGLDWMSLQVFSDLSDSVSPQFLHNPQHIHIPWAWPLEAWLEAPHSACPVPWPGPLPFQGFLGWVQVPKCYLRPWMQQLVSCIQLGKEPAVLLLAPETHY